MARRRTILLQSLACLVSGGIIQFAASACLSFRSWPACAGFSNAEVPWGTGILHQRLEPSPQAGRVAEEFVASGFGWTCRMASSDQQPLADPAFRHAGLRTAGWPLPAFAGGYLSDTTTNRPVHYAAFLFQQEPTPYYMWAFVPLRPVWTGLLADAAAFAVAVMGAAHLPALARRWHRRRGGRCMACGHPLAGLSRCPECGYAGKPPTIVGPA